MTCFNHDFFYSPVNMGVCEPIEIAYQAHILAQCLGCLSDEGSQ